MKFTLIFGLILVLVLQGCDEAGSAAVEARDAEANANAAQQSQNITNLQDTIDDLVGQLASTDEEIAALEAKLDEWPVFVDWNNQAYVVIDGELALAEEAHLVNQPDIQFILSEYVDLISKRDSLIIKINSLQENLNVANTEIELLESELTQVYNDLADCLDEKDDLTIKLEVAQTELAATQSELDTVLSLWPTSKCVVVNNEIVIGDTNVRITQHILNKIVYLLKNYKCLRCGVKHYCRD